MRKLGLWLFALFALGSITVTVASTPTYNYFVVGVTPANVTPFSGLVFHCGTEEGGAKPNTSTWLVNDKDASQLYFALADACHPTSGWNYATVSAWDDFVEPDGTVTHQEFTPTQEVSFFWISGRAVLGPIPGAPQSALKAMPPGTPNSGTLLP